MNQPTEIRLIKMPPKGPKYPNQVAEIIEQLRIHVSLENIETFTYSRQSKDPDSLGDKGYGKAAVSDSQLQ